MKKNIALTVIQWIVGLLFIFSGLIKANDPLGLSYKMQEFFDAWGLSALDSYTLAFSLIMNVFEVLAGVAVIIGWQLRLFSWLLLLLIIFFCYLTGYAFLSGKIKTCGCFGDCIPLLPLQSFIKDIALLILVLILFINKKRIFSFLKKSTAITILILSVMMVSLFQYYVLKHLPVLDCLPYKVGKNIAEEMTIPSGSVADSFALTFRYKKNGKTVEFDADHIPENLDSTYEFVDRYDKLIRRGNNTPAIADFALRNLNGRDTTIQILNQGNYYVLVFMQNMSSWNNQSGQFYKLTEACKSKNIPLFVVTSNPQAAYAVFKNGLSILGCDATVIKTAARVNGTYFLMRQANIKAKKSYADADKFIEAIDKQASTQ